MKKYASVLTITGVMYLLGAFIAMDLNPSNWSVEGRVIIAMMALIAWLTT